METNQVDRGGDERETPLQSCVQTIHLFRIDENEIEFRLLCDGKDHRRTLARGCIEGLPLDAKASDRFEVIMQERRDPSLDPFQRHHCVGLRITCRASEPTLADIEGPEADAVRSVIRKVFGRAFEERSYQQMVDRVRELESRKRED